MASSSLLLKAVFAVFCSHVAASAILTASTSATMWSASWTVNTTTSTVPSSLFLTATVTASPTPFPTPFPNATAHNPAAIGSWFPVGCIGSESGFVSLVKVATSLLMTQELCISACPNSKFSATQYTDCFCGNALDNETGPSFTASGICNLPCPGNPTEFCGGVTFTNNTKREILGPRATVLLLTLYQNAAFTPAAAGTPFPAVPTVAPVPGNFAPGDIIVNVNEFIYIDICQTCPGGLAYFPTTTTVTGTACGCATETAPACPLTTVTKSCACGPGGASSSVVLTLPVGPVNATGYALPSGTGVGTGVLTMNAGSARPTQSPINAAARNTGAFGLVVAITAALFATCLVA